MSPSVQTQITNDQIATAQMQSKTDTLTGSATKLTSSDFLNLMLKQMQYQDPMDPQDNSQMISQEAQFSQLQQTSEINDTLANYTSAAQASSLVGKGVVLTDPDDKSKVISGTVTAALMDGKDSAVTINGTDYPLKYILYSYDPSKVSVGSGTSTDSGTSSGTSSST